MARPGIIVYFELRQQLSLLSYEEKGKMLDAMLEYGECGTIPEFTGMLAMAWGFIKTKLDRDSDEYDLSVKRRQYATDCRERKKHGEPSIGFDEWMIINDYH